MRHIVNAAPNDEANLDTYANLLYKTGKIQQAIFWENQTITMAVKNKVDMKDPSALKTFQDNLAKMKKGDPTWTTS